MTIFRVKIFRLPGLFLRHAILMRYSLAELSMLHAYASDIGDQGILVLIPNVWDEFFKIMGFKSIFQNFLIALGI